MPDSFNIYQISDSASAAILYQMFQGLITTYNLTGQVEPALAESWQLSPDQRSYTVTLRPGLRWSDGHPLTADDVVFTYNRVINHPNIPNNFRDFLTLDGAFPQVAKLDDRRIRFTVAKPFVPFLQNLSAPIVPRHILAQTLQRQPGGKLPFHQTWTLGTPASQIVVNGPWKLEEYVPGSRVTLIRNPYYYKQDPQGEKLPMLERQVVLQVQDLNAALMHFKARQSDALALRAEDYDTLKAASHSGEFTIHNLGASSSTLFAVFNQSTATDSQGRPLVDTVKSSWFRDLHFRRALAHAIDREGISQSIYKGRAQVQLTHMPRQSAYYTPEVPSYPYNMAQARQELQASGFRLKNGQLYDRRGHPVRFELITNAGNTQRDAICAMLRRSWQALGIQVHYRPISFDQVTHRLHRSFRWEAILIGLRGNLSEPHFFFSRWKRDGRMHLFNRGHPQQWNGRQATRFEPWEREMESLYQQAAQEFNPQRRQALYWQAQRLEATNLPFLYTVDPLSLIAVKNQLKNIFPSPFAGSGLEQINWNSEYHFIEP